MKAGEEDVGDRTTWLLTFVDPDLEAEYVGELNTLTRRPLLVTICIALVIMVGEFFTSGAQERIAEEDMAARTTAYSRVLGFASMLVCLFTAWSDKIQYEKLAMTFAMLLSSLIFTSNAYRMTKVVGGDYFWREYSGCGAEVCYDDTAMMLGLACIASGVQIFIAVRSAFSWTLPVMQAALYAGMSLSGLGPLTAASTIVYVVEYVALMGFIWTGCYTSEASARLRWKENRRLRLEVEKHREELEAQMQRFHEIEERLEAMNFSDRVPPRSEVEGLKVPVSGHHQVLTVARPHLMPTATSRGSSEGGWLVDLSDSPQNVPNQLLAGAMSTKKPNLALVRRMAERIRHPEYNTRAFFEDVLEAFPELGLFFAIPLVPVQRARSTTIESLMARSRSRNSTASCVAQIAAEASASERGSRSREAASVRLQQMKSQEYQRTIGAMFAVYWLLRLDIDGKHGFCFGVDEDWQTRAHPDCPLERHYEGDSSVGKEGSASTVQSPHNPAVSSTRAGSITASTHIEFPRRRVPDRNLLRSRFRPGQVQKSSSKMFNVNSLIDYSSPEWQRRKAFFEDMEWSAMQEVVSLAVGNDVDRIQAMLCLTAFHDIMKVPELCPRVAADHAPYQGYEEGDIINDHDAALAYVLEHYPDLLPSYRMLPRHLKEVVLFTQQKMQFNHGWFVQAEASPGATLSALKQVLSGAQPGDLSFYFMHWLTDLSGAEGTPLGGAEKFVLKFPRQVLSAFLWSIPYLGQLEREAETVVVENYLKARWQALFPTLSLPSGRTAVARLRLAVMAQSGAAMALEAFRKSSRQVREVLEKEMARTGINGQKYRSSPVQGGPAFLVYYGPALLQRCQTPSEMLHGLAALAAVYAAGRALWPVQAHRQGETVTLEVGQMKGSREATFPLEARSIWVLVQKNKKEAAVELVPAQKVNELMVSGAKFWGVDVDAMLDNQEEGADEPEPEDEALLDEEEAMEPIESCKPSGYLRAIV